MLGMVRSQVLHHWARLVRLQWRMVGLHYRLVSLQWRMVGLHRNRVVSLHGRMVRFYWRWWRWRGWWGWMVRLHWSSLVWLNWRWWGRVVGLHWRMRTVDGGMFVMVRLTREEMSLCHYIENITIPA